MILSLLFQILEDPTDLKWSCKSFANCREARICMWLAPAKLSVQENENLTNLAHYISHSNKEKWTTHYWQNIYH